MAARPWLTPDELKNYTDHKEVAERSDDKLKVDIMRAEAKIISITHNDFSDEKYETIPEQVRLATMLAAEAYAKNVVSAKSGKIKSETFDDYSYTLESTDISLDGLDLYELLRDYIQPEAGGSVNMRLWSL